MAIFRVNKETHFTTVNNHILRNKEASLKAKGLLVWMLSCDKDWNFSLSGMEACLKEKEDALSSTLKELETLGYLKRTKLMPETDETTGEVTRSRVEWVYDIYEIPQILYTGFQSIEIQCTENPVTRNTKDKEIPILKKAPDAVLSEAPKHSRNFRKDTELLKDVLASGEEIKKQDDAKKVKKTQRQKCVEELDEKEYNFSDNEKAKLIEYLDWAMSGNDSRRIRNVDLWRTKLRSLLQISNGSNIINIVQQSLDNKWYKFVELNNTTHKSSKPINDDKVKSQKLNTVEEIQAEKKRRLEATGGFVLY